MKIVYGILGTVFILFGVALLGSCIWLAPTIRWIGEGSFVVFGALAIIWMGYDLIMIALSLQKT